MKRSNKLPVTIHYHLLAFCTLMCLSLESYKWGSISAFLYISCALIECVLNLRAIQRTDTHIIRRLVHLNSKQANIYLDHVYVLERKLKEIQEKK